MKKELQTSSVLHNDLPQKEKNTNPTYTVIVIYNHSSWGKEKKRLVEIPLEEAASENKWKDKKVITLCYKEVFINKVYPTMHLGFSEDYPFILEVDQPW